MIVLDIYLGEGGQDTMDCFAITTTLNQGQYLDFWKILLGQS